MENSAANFNAHGPEPVSAPPVAHVALRVRIIPLPIFTPFPIGNRVGSMLLCSLIEARLPGARVNCSGPLNRGSFLVTCADHRPAIKTLRAIIAEVGLEPVSRIFWLDAAEGIWRCAYPNPSLRLSIAAIRADIAHERAVVDLALRQCARVLSLLQFGRSLPARLRALASAFRSRL
jgi:hypothetical protein